MADIGKVCVRLVVWLCYWR